MRFRLSYYKIKTPAGFDMTLRMMVEKHLIFTVW